MNESSVQTQPEAIVFHPHPKDKRFRDLTGRRFHHLEILGYAGRKQGRLSQMWWVKCECGVVKVAASSNVVSGSIKSCGCKKFHYNSIAHKRHGMTHSREFVTWSSMKARCLNRNDPFFSQYGGRGISICERWVNSFDNFYEDMGQRPAGMSLDRVDVNGNYSKANCKWSTQSEQCRNMRSNRILTLNGVGKCVAEWSKETGIKSSTIFERLRRGLSDEETLTTQVGYRNATPSRKASTGPGEQASLQHQVDPACCE